ncbi:UNVERIFIED_CONTAM: hypothetical protein K2H54_013483 [Gekko kuhli]
MENMIENMKRRLMEYSLLTMQPQQQIYQRRREIQRQRLSMVNNSSPIRNSYEDAEFAIHEDISNNSMSFPDLISNLPFNPIVAFITAIFTSLICIAGIVGNGMVIWLLGFCMRRNPFTIYVLNLAVADIGVLISTILECIVCITFLLNGDVSFLGIYICTCVWALMYITDQLLLTIISVDRCVAVLFPLWHRCHRPPHLSGIVCVSTWVLSLLIVGLDVFLSFVNEFILLQFLVNVALCTPVMTISTVILFVKSYSKSQQHKRGKLFLAISLALFFFLLFGLPVNYFYTVIYQYSLDGTDVKSLFSSILDYSEFTARVRPLLLSRIHLTLIPVMVIFACTVLNCSINPLIYFLVGRKKKGQSWQSLKAALQRIFKDEDNNRRQEGTQSETQF